MISNFFKGLITAIITPFKGGEIDFISLDRILQFQISNKVEAIIVAGSTGEGNSLNEEEYELLLREIINYSYRKLIIIASCGSTSLRKSIKLANVAEKLGVDGLLCNIPPYLKPNQEGIYKYFLTLHDSVSLPIMLYSVPSRTNVDFSDNTILELSLLDKIQAIKDSSQDIERPLRIASKINRSFHFLAGNDEMALAYNAHGGVGCISVLSNIAPTLCKQIQTYCSNQDYAKALGVQLILLPLCKALFTEPNPIGIKYAASYFSLCSDELRLPLVKASYIAKEKIKNEIEILMAYNKKD